MQTNNKRWALPLALGLITGLLLLAVLWPKAEPKQMVVVAARDLGAGQTITSADLSTVELLTAQAPADAVADPAQLAGQTLAVVRFAGEPITLRHLGAAVSLQPDERGIALQVKADTGLAGILRPGMTVGVIATLPVDSTAGSRPDPTGALYPALQGNSLYAKTVLEGLRVLYVSPDFQARPYQPATASANVKPGASTSGNTETATYSSGTAGTVREGVLLLAASTQPITLSYTLAAALEPMVALTDTVAPPASLTAEPPAPATVTFVPVELLAALNAAGGRFALTLAPDGAQAYTSTGTTLDALLAPTVAEPAGGVR